MKTQVVQILIRRNLTSQTTDVVLSHEVPILKVIRGAANITVTDQDCGDFELKAADVKSRDELIRLKQKYRGFVIDGQNPVDLAFPDGSRDVELYYKDPSVFASVGEVEGGGVIGDDEVETVDIVEVPDAAEENLPVPTPTASVVEVPTAPAAIDLNDRPVVVAKLKELGVPFAKTVATKHLATLLTKSLEAGAAE